MRSTIYAVLLTTACFAACIIFADRVRVGVGIVSRAMNPGLSECGRCGMSWGWTDGHATWYAAPESKQKVGHGLIVYVGSGCFPLCEHCWSRLTPKERLPYYRELWDDWNSDGAPPNVEWRQIEMAVMAGL